MLGRDGLGGLGPGPVEAVENNEPHGGRSDNQDDGLQHIRQHHCLQPTGGGVDPGKQSQSQAKPEQVLPPAIRKEQLVEHQRPGVKPARHIDHNRQEDGDAGQIKPHTVVVAFGQKLRNRGDPGADVERQDEDGREHEDEPGHPLVGGDGNPGGIGIARQTDERLGGNIGREQRKTDDAEAQGTPGEEQIITAFGLARHVDADSNHDGEIADD